MFGHPIIDVVLLTLWVAWIAQSWLTVMSVAKFRKRIVVGGHLGREFSPPAIVIVPFKGIDADLPACVASLCTQQYADYRLIFVLESADDPADAVLRTQVARFPQRSVQFIYAGVADAHEGQKVHNQLHVLRRIEPTASDDDVWVFVDSDAVPGSTWLHDMVRPLRRRNIALVTGYRWLVPEPGVGGAFWSRMASVINSSVACFSWRGAWMHAWGGSMAMQVSTARQGHLLERLDGSITDDYPMTLMCRALGKRIYFQPRCLVATPAGYDFASLLNFGHRQYLITRVYIRSLYLAALALTSLWLLAFMSAWGVLVWQLAGDRQSGHWVWPLGAIVIVWLGQQVRASLRAGVIQEAFGEEALKALRPTLRLDRWATPLWMALHWLVIVRAGIGRKMVWRGIGYHIRGPQDVARIDP